MGNEEETIRKFVSLINNEENKVDCGYQISSDTLFGKMNKSKDYLIQ